MIITEQAIKILTKKKLRVKQKSSLLKLKKSLDDGSEFNDKDAVFLTPMQVSQIYGISCSNLEIMRRTNKDNPKIPFVKENHRLIYKASDIDKYLNNKKR